MYRLCPGEKGGPWDATLGLATVKGQVRQVLVETDVKCFQDKSLYYEH